MTVEDYTAGLPAFVGSDLDVKPPLLFRGVTARFFPLRASLVMLQQLCDGYLNIVPSEAGYFRAPLPYVFLVVLNYGQMSDEVERTGWFSQVEVYFGVFVEWYKRIRGRWEFQGWAVITPYIFVDDDVSVPVGRTVYGYPKVLANLEMIDSRWTKNPIAPLTVARVATKVFPQMYRGGNLEDKVFLEIERSGISNLRVPFDSGSTLMPWTIAANLANAAGGFNRDLLWLLQSLRIFPVTPGADPNIAAAMFSHVPQWLSPAAPGLVVNSLNLKQFRRAERPDKLCFQSLTNGRLRTTGFNRAGLLGENSILFGDFSGGYSVKLSEHQSLPIARTLGLDVHRSWKADSLDVVEVKPVMPFWLDLDLKFYEGTNIAWRTDDGQWYDETGQPFPVPREPDPDFNDSVSIALEAIAGPFQFFDSVIHVIPLLADVKQLKKFLGQNINQPLKDQIKTTSGEPIEGVQLDLWNVEGAEYIPIHLIVTSYGDVISESNNIGHWAKYELTFLIPVRWQRMTAGKWQTLGVGLVPAFTFADNSITAMSRLEIQGVPERTAKFYRPANVWLGQETYGHSQETLLRVEAEVLPALGVGQQAAFHPIIEITRKDRIESERSPHVQAGYDAYLAAAGKAFESKAVGEVGRALALEPFGNQAPFTLYTLKQFRDVQDPEKACYQSLLRIPRVLTDVVRKRDDAVAVRIYDYPGFHIVKDLGILAQPLKGKTAGIGYVTHGINPFLLHATVEEQLADRLLRRAGSKQWIIYDQAFHGMLGSAEGAHPIKVSLEAERLLGEIDPKKIPEMLARLKSQVVKEDDKITADKARQVVDKVDAQTIIESFLEKMEKRGS